MNAQTDAVKTFLDGPAEPARARAIAQESPAGLLALVDRLVADARRAHLEAMGEADLPKDVKKAARKAAYKLKSAGVEGTAARGPGLDLKAVVDLGDAALLVAPGLRGRYTVIARGLPGVPGVKVSADGGRVTELERLEDLSAGRLRKVIHEERQSPGPRLPHLAHASLAVRVLERMEAEVRAGGGELPPSWSNVDAWRAAATSHGAVPAQASARAALGAALENLDINLQRTTHRLLELPELGSALPPEWVLEALSEKLEAAVHSDLEMTRGQFEERLAGLARDALDGWLANAAERTSLAGRLELSADVLHAAGHREGALQTLWVAGQLGDPERAGHDIQLLDRAMQQLLSSDAAWEHYQAHLRGEDHHEHEAT